jgi:S-DNA-T family DNA segregation ATPase FtsK/SpoIIIE
MAKKQTKTKDSGPIRESKNSTRKGSGLKNFFSAMASFLTNERTHKVFGLFLLLFSFFLLFSFVSYFFNWQEDYDKVSQSSWFTYLSDKNIKAENALGKLGALFSFIFFNNWFGVAAFFIPFLLFLLSVRIFLGVSLLNLSKTFLYVGFFMLYISVSSSFFSEGETSMISGGFGYAIGDLLHASLGKIGSLLMLLFILGAFLILVMKINIRMPEWKRKEKADEALKQAEGSPMMDKLKGMFSTKGVDDDETENDDEADDAPFETQNEPTPAYDNENSLDEFEFESPVITESPQAKKANINKPVMEEPEFFIDEQADEILAPDNNNIQEIEELSELDKERMNIVEVTNEEEDFDLDDYDPTLDLSDYKYPELDLLEQYSSQRKVDKNELMQELEANKNRIIETLKNYNIGISKIKASVGPTVTLYEIVPEAGVRISKIKNLEDDIALSLAALGIRIIAPMPGKGTIGIEVPNQNPEIVPMRTMLSSDKFVNANMELPVALGKTISNDPFVADLAKMPHLLMAGATGQGKSVGLNAILVSLLYKKHPSQIKFVLVDPKKVELTLFTKIERHFLAKLPDGGDAIITDTKKVVHTLNSLCVLMDERYELLKLAMVRNIKEYNAKFLSRKLNPKKGHHFMPYIVLVVDEFADLIMTAGKEVELPIARLAQLARAIGIHLIIATQRPSVNIITGTIKANFPARIAFRVTSKIDSRTILDSGGADQLIGRGDMLFSTGSDLVRLQCPFVDTPEVDKITDFIGSQRGYPSAFELPEFVDENADQGDDDFDIGDRDAMFDDAAHIVVMHQQGSASLLQRKLKLGYNRAGRIIDQLEKAGIIGPFEGSKARKVLVKDALALEQFLNNQS